MYLCSCCQELNPRYLVIVTVLSYQSHINIIKYCSDWHKFHKPSKYNYTGSMSINIYKTQLHLPYLATISLLTYLWFIFSSSGMCSTLYLKVLKCLHFQDQTDHSEAEGTTFLCYTRKYLTTWHHFPEDFILQQCCCKKLKPHISVKITI
jgi:hypothetical protein